MRCDNLSSSTKNWMGGIVWTSERLRFEIGIVKSLKLEDEFFPTQRV